MGPTIEPERKIQTEFEFS